MAKAFRFRLEPVLRYRQHLEEEKKRALADARKAVMQQNHDLMELLMEENEGKKRFRKAKMEAKEVRQLRLQEQYLNAVARRIRLEFEELQKKLLAEELARRELVHARKQVRALERLRERRKDQYHYELGRSEQKELDEIGLQMFRGKGLTR